MTTETARIIDELATQYRAPRLAIDSMVNLILNKIDAVEGLEIYLGGVGMPWKISLSSLAVDSDEVIRLQTTTKDWTPDTIDKFNRLFNNKILPTLKSGLEQLY